MRVALEIAGEYRLMHSLEIPGLCARGKDVSSLSMQLRAEARRLQLCHSWLPCLPVTICMVEERLEMPAPPAAAFSWLLAGDLEWDAGCLQAACRMLNEEAAQLRSCYDSYPDVDYDYSADRPENGKTGSAGSARAQLEGFIGRLQPYWALYGLEWRPDAFWPENLAGALHGLSQKPEFARNRLFWADGEFWCATRWLRCLLWEVRSCEGRLYDEGIHIFGRSTIPDAGHFES